MSNHDELAGIFMGGGVVAPTYEAKSIIVDSAGNWGNIGNTGIRELDFYLNSILIPAGAAEVSAVGTSRINASFTQHLSFYTALSKIGNQINNGWAGFPSNQRLSAVFTTEITFDQILFYNAHNGGSNTNVGAKDIKIYLSPNVITSTVYGASITGGVLIFDGQVPEHSNVNEPDPYDIPLI